ncbi:MAG: cache domain-containing protein [Pseudobdellovibrionaceae bacterium]
MSTNTDKKNNNANGLIAASCDLESSLKIFEEINQKSHFIALSASIEGARMKSLGTFSVVAQQIALQSSKNSELSERLRTLVNKIKTQAFEAVAIRNLELAADLIDKLDRNLFERNCDVQAWGTFDEVKTALSELSPESAQKASEQLEKLVGIYVVYLNSILLDFNGQVVCSPRKKELCGQNLSRELWFQEALSGKVTVTDLQFFEFLENHSVLYCAPVMSANNEVIGVLANCFDWQYAQEMITSAGFSDKTKALVIDNKAQIIASKRSSQILKDNLEWLEAGERATNKTRGYSLEKARNGENLAVGFAYTKGYNAYAGKGWSALICEGLAGFQTTNACFVTEELLVASTAVVSQIQSEKSGSELLNTMKEINLLVEEINSNNREVRLLAVNASIQAGLAGSEGEGFSIIANEVAHLAQKSLVFVDGVNISTKNLRHSVEESSAVRQLDAAKDTISKVDRNLFERYCDIQAWSTFSKFRETLVADEKGDKAAMDLLKNIHRIYEVYHDIYVLNLSGQVVANATAPGMVGKDFSKSPWFVAAAAGQIYYSDVIYSDILKSPVITFSSGIYNDKQEIIGVIASQFNCNFINDILKATIVDSASECLLLNAQGLVIAAKSSEDVLKRKLKNTPSFVLHFQPGAFGVDSEANDMNIAYSSSKGYNTYKGQDWTLVAQKPKSNLNQQEQLTPAERFKQKMRRAG